MLGEALGEIGGEARDQVDELLRDAVARGVPVASRRCRTARTGRRRSSGACPRAPGSGRSRSGCRSRRRRPRARRRSQRSNAAWASAIVPVASIVAWAGQLAPGAAVQVGRRSRRALNLTTGLRIFQSSRRSRNSASTSASASIAGHPLRVGVADHGRGAELGAVLERHPLAGRDPATGTPQASTAPASAAASAIAKRAHPHAALDVAPDRALAVEVALVVHELDRRGAGLVGPAPGADDPLAEERRLQPLVGDVAVEHLGDRGLEDEVDHLLRAAEHRLDLLAGRACRRPRCRGRPCAAACGRRRRAPRRPSSRRCPSPRRPAPSRLACVFASSSHWAKAVPSSNGTQRLGSATQ